MKIDIDQFNNLRLREVFSGVLMETSEGNQIGVCMRDDTLEINVCPRRQEYGQLVAGEHADGPDREHALHDRAVCPFRDGVQRQCAQQGK